MDAKTLAGWLRTDAAFRGAALADADAIVAEHILDASLLIAVSRMLDLDPWQQSPRGRAEHAALFALIASAHHRPEA